VQTTEIGVADAPTYYTLLTDAQRRTAFLLVRADDATPVPRVVSSRLQLLDPKAFALVTTVERRLLEATGPAWIGAAVTGAIGLLALGVAAVGIHGVIAYTVSCRTREIGIYRALGATHAHVLRLILGWTLRGVAIGLAGALFVMTLGALAIGSRAQPLLHGLHPLDPLAFVLGSSVLLAVVAVAAYLPARRALGMAPLTALRRDSY
jgi:ABC-type antimicrobial peptide transport system permease subunit